MKDKTWIDLKEMSEMHLENVIHLHERKARDGLTVEYWGVDDNGWPYSFYDTAYGEDAFRVLKTNEYRKELAKRK
jgi:hypothetical protein